MHFNLHANTDSRAGTSDLNQIWTNLTVFSYTMQLWISKLAKKKKKKKATPMGFLSVFMQPKGTMALPHTGCTQFAISKNLLCYQNYFSSSNTAMNQPAWGEPCFAPAPPGNCKHTVHSQQGAHNPLLPTKPSTANSWMHNCLCLLTSARFWGIPTSMTRKKMTLPLIF